ncbi:MAG TPA: HNH endonuclease, partial [Opitutaceae bacterium]|nr:HNH endonuclease [Opitutaceae bacterium]
MELALEQPVLVLNRLWQAVNVIGARRAFGLLVRGHASVVHHYEDDFRVFTMMDWIDFSRYNPPIAEVEMVHTVRHTIRLPRV